MEIPPASKNKDMAIELWDGYIRRTHRSHKPYGKGCDEAFKNAFIAAWKNEENDSYFKICKEIAG